MPKSKSDEIASGVAKGIARVLVWGFVGIVLLFGILPILARMFSDWFYD